MDERAPSEDSGEDQLNGDLLWIWRTENSFTVHTAQREQFPVSQEFRAHISSQLLMLLLHASKHITIQKEM